jgi:hypothetical protein
MIRILTVLALALAASACATVPSGNYEAYLQAKAAERTQQASATQAFADIATNCKDPGCVQIVAAFAALSAGNGRGADSIAAPPREQSGAEKFATVMGAMAPLVGTMVNGVVSMQQSKSAERSAEDQWSAINGIVSTTTAGIASVANTGSGNMAAVAGNATANMADVARNARPSITVGGDYVQGDGNTVVRGQVGDSAGRDLVNGDQYQGPVAGRDQIGRDQVVDSHIGDNDRYSSPGPYDRTCSGTSCQTTNPPPAEDDEPVP